AVPEDRPGATHFDCEYPHAPLSVSAAVGHARMNTRNRPWAAPTSAARKPHHAASNPMSPRSARTAPSARIGLAPPSPIQNGHGSTSLSAVALSNPLTFSATTSGGRMVSIALSISPPRPDPVLP